MSGYKCSGCGAWVSGGIYHWCGAWTGQLAGAPATLKPAASVSLDSAGRERLKKFHDAGLLWLVNTSVLHPRGLALAIHLDDETGEALGLSVVGEGDEPWVFGDDQMDDDGVPFGLVKRYMAAESAREAEWSPKLRAGRGGGA